MARKLRKLIGEPRSSIEEEAYNLMIELRKSLLPGVQAIRSKTPIDNSPTAEKRTRQRAQSLYRLLET